MLRHPIVANVMRAGCIRLRGVQVEWQERPYRQARCVRWIGLLEGRALIGKATDAAEASKVVIERPIFLNQDHYMFDVSYFGATGRNGKKRRRSAATGQPQSRQFCYCRRSSEFK